MKGFDCLGNDQTDPDEAVYMEETCPSQNNTWHSTTLVMLSSSVFLLPLYILLGRPMHAHRWGQGKEHLDCFPLEESVLNKKISCFTTAWCHKGCWLRLSCVNVFSYVSNKLNDIKNSKLKKMVFQGTTLKAHHFPYLCCCYRKKVN